VDRGAAEVSGCAESALRLILGEPKRLDTPSPTNILK
jgi:hypothetical protein